jgi:tetratricopeptide (TPR) repeat protein
MKDHLQQGKELYRLGKKEEAVRAFTAAIAKNPSNVEAYTLRGSALNALKRYSEAIADQTKVIELNPTALAYYFRGNTYHMAGHSRRALADIEQSLRLDPSNARAQENRRFLMLYLEQHPEADS